MSGISLVLYLFIEAHRNFHKPFLTNLLCSRYFFNNFIFNEFNLAEYAWWMLRPSRGRQPVRRRSTKSKQIASTRIHHTSLLYMLSHHMVGGLGAVHLLRGDFLFVAVAALTIDPFIVRVHIIGFRRKRTRERSSMCMCGFLLYYSIFFGAPRSKNSTAKLCGSREENCLADEVDFFVEWVRTKLRMKYICSLHTVNVSFLISKNSYIKAYYQEYMCYSMIGFYIIDLIWINTKFAILKIGGIEHFRHDSLINIIARLNSTAGGNGGLNTRWLAKRVTSRPIVSNWLKQVNFNGSRRPATLGIGMIDYIRFEWNLESALLVVRWEYID